MAGDFAEVDGEVPGLFGEVVPSTVLVTLGMVVGTFVTELEIVVIAES